MEPDKQVAQLERQLRECLVARGGMEDDFGRLITELFSKEITRITRDITSDKYRKDHTGYNNALSDLLAYKKILKSLQLAAAPEREAKIRSRLEDKADE